MEVVIIRGQQHSGCHSLANELRIAGYKHIDPLMFFINDLGETHYREHHMALAYEWCYREVERALNKGLDVVVSGDFSNLMDLHPFRSMNCSLRIFDNRHLVSTSAVRFVRSRTTAYQRQQQRKTIFQNWFSAS